MKIKIKRETYLYENGIKVIIDYDKRGNVVHRKCIDPNNTFGMKVKEYWKKYDENGNEIQYQGVNSFGKFKVFRKFNEFRKPVYIKENVVEKWYEYDENGNEIHYIDSLGNEHYNQYDENNNLIKHIDLITKKWGPEYDKSYDVEYEYY